MVCKTKHVLLLLSCFVEFMWKSSLPLAWSVQVLADHLDISRALLDSDLSSSFSLDSAPKDHTPPKKLHQFPAKDVARELTLMDSQMLRDIRPEELQDLAWTKKGTKVSRVQA